MVQSFGTHSFVLIHFLLGFVNNIRAEVTCVAIRHVMLSLKVSSHVILFVGHMSQAHFAHISPIQGSLSIFRHYIWVK